MLRLAFGAAMLAGIYALTLASADALDLATGFVLGLALLVALRAWLFPADREPGPPAPPRRALAFVPFAVAVLADIVVGTWDVALRVMHLRPLEQPGIIAVPIGDRSELGLAVSALVMTLSPGSVLLDVDRRRGVMLIHAIDAADPDAFRARMQTFYDRWQRPVFP